MISLRLCVSLAQWLEHWSHNPKVGCSSQAGVILFAYNFTQIHIMRKGLSSMKKYPNTIFLYMALYGLYIVELN